MKKWPTPTALATSMLLALFATTPVAADETCNSPYLSTLI